MADGKGSPFAHRSGKLPRSPVPKEGDDFQMSVDTVTLPLSPGSLAMLNAQRLLDEEAKVAEAAAAGVEHQVLTVHRTSAVSIQLEQSGGEEMFG